jgi:penicillin-binding protein-related factor A (putative recombinase)
MSKVSEIWGTEVPLYFPKIYAGTTDCVGMYEGAPAIIDFKQTLLSYKNDYQLYRKNDHQHFQFDHFQQARMYL